MGDPEHSRINPNTRRNSTVLRTASRVFQQRDFELAGWIASRFPARFGQCHDAQFPAGLSTLGFAVRVSDGVQHRQLGKRRM
jgi:hypothetical protein